MLLLPDGLPARRVPVVNILLIVANSAVFIMYELPNMNSERCHAPRAPSPRRTRSESIGSTESLS